MTSQAKTLKQTLKSLNIANEFGGLTVKTERKYIGTNSDGKKLYEYGNAIAHVDYIDGAKANELLNALPYCKIYRNKELDFSVIEY